MMRIVWRQHRLVFAMERLESACNAVTHTRASRACVDPTLDIRADALRISTAKVGNWFVMSSGSVQAV